VGDHELDGALIQVAGDDGLVAELTLLLRPLSGLLAGIEQMGRRLAEEPLPSDSA
jgi:hypothetical protein